MKTPKKKKQSGEVLQNTKMTWNAGNDEGKKLHHRYEASKNVPDLGDTDDEKVIPALKARRGYWNSVTFDADDLLSGRLVFID